MRNDLNTKGNPGSESLKPFQMKPEVICLVGSTSQQEELVKANEDLTLRGHVVLSLGVFRPEIQSGWLKEMLRQIHRRKIEMSDVVAVVPKKDGSVGEHVREEINFAFSKEKHVCKVHSALKGIFDDWPRES